MVTRGPVIFIDFEGLFEVHIFLEDLRFFGIKINTLILQRPNGTLNIIHILRIIHGDLPVILIAACSSSDLLHVVPTQNAPSAVVVTFSNGLENDPLDVEVHSHADGVRSHKELDFVLPFIEYFSLVDF